MLLAGISKPSAIAGGPSHRATSVEGKRFWRSVAGREIFFDCFAGAPGNRCGYDTSFNGPAGRASSSVTFYRGYVSAPQIRDRFDALILPARGRARAEH